MTTKAAVVLKCPPGRVESLTIHSVDRTSLKKTTESASIISVDRTNLAPPRHSHAPRLVPSLGWTRLPSGILPTLHRPAHHAVNNHAYCAHFDAMSLSLADELVPIPKATAHGELDSLANALRRSAALAVILVFLLAIVFFILTEHDHGPDAEAAHRLRSFLSSGENLTIMIKADR